MSRLSIISHYYNHLSMVLDQIAYWESLPDSFLSQVEFILIDDCSEQRHEFAPTRLDLHVFRITTDIPWNQGGARNLATIMARSDWALFFDIDQRFHLEPMAELIATLDRMQATVMYYLKGTGLFDESTGTAADHHFNTFLVNVANFKVNGLYDEDFAGRYGYEDVYLPMVWVARGGQRILIMDRIFFADLGFRTTTLDRDTSANYELLKRKVAAGIRKPAGILRFAWEAVPVPRIGPRVGAPYYQPAK